MKTGQTRGIARFEFFWAVLIQDKSYYRLWYYSMYALVVYIHLIGEATILSPRNTPSSHPH